MPETVSVPALIVVSPVYVLVAEKVKVPEPTFVKDPVPEITPETVSSPESPDVKVIPLANSTPPEPLSDWIVSVTSTSYVPEFITSVVSAKVPVNFKVPAEIIVSPV